MAGQKIGAVVALCAAAAGLAAPVRIRTMSPVGIGVVENPKADGMVKLQFVESVPEFNGLPGIRAHVHLHTFKPNTTYGVLIDCVAGFVDEPFAVTTNGGGNGNWVVMMSSNGDEPDPENAVIVVYREIVTDGGYTVTEERAIGVPD